MIPLPQPTEGPRVYLSRLIQVIESNFRNIEAPVSAYTVTNEPDPPVRTLNVSTATTSDLAKVLAALIKDLQTKGIIDR